MPPPTPGGSETQYTFRANDRNVFVTGGEYRDHFARTSARMTMWPSTAMRIAPDADWGVFVQDDASVSQHVALHLGALHLHSAPLETTPSILTRAPSEADQIADLVATGRAVNRTPEASSGFEDQLGR